MSKKALNFLGAAVGLTIGLGILWMVVEETLLPMKPTANKNPAPAKEMPDGGKLPVAIGDINLWDNEDPNYCGNCKSVCDTGFWEGRSTECDLCQAKCSGLRKD